MEPVWSGWDAIIKTAVAGPLGYLAVVVMLRSVGKRALSKLNMYDFVMTIAMGSTLAALFLGSTALIPGVVAFLLLLLCQYLTTLATTHSTVARRIFTAPPQLLFANGRFYSDAIVRNRMNSDELEAAVRDSSCGSFDRVAAMVLETDGTVSVIPKDQAGDLGVLPDSPEPDVR